ncbi:alpha/beta hydrolase [Allopusillimonas soli]|uniref:Alpha/beta hydrolase n=1 Tax=Allopusillimonas soli TaxID=659016 RepID=A0A853FCV1_9BURK|nr:alpha/beta hydrolase [Allopusillimonas soli]NYT38654.1 alpha/beta hydrolase [Allopusillimonas soli]TEA71638.1 alpha/beta hydrolase [Allopusillimonas soli]
MNTFHTTGTTAQNQRDFDAHAFWQQFQHREAQVGSIRLHYVEGGQGRPLLLIPGWPQSWYTWRHVMPALAASDRRVIAIDPRGLGDSDKPIAGYDLATVAQDLHQFALQTGLMSHGALDVAGHDIGAWISYAWVADWPGDIGRLALYDAALPGITPPPPAGVLSEEGNIRTWHFGFNRLADLPELLVEGRERAYLDWLFRAKLRISSAITAADLDEYTRVFSAPGAARAGFAYYRALFNGDGLEQNRRRATRRLSIPVMAWGASDGVGNILLDTIRYIADDVRGGTIEACGHYVPEEAPETVIRQLAEFFTE